MYPGSYPKATMVCSDQVYVRPQLRPQTPPPPQLHHPSPPMDATDTTEIFDPDFKFIYDVPASAVVHLPPARLNITRLVLCRNYRPYDAQSCAMGSNCKFVHADCDYAKLEAHPIHVNYIWRHESFCTYPRLPAGDTLTIWAPNNKQPSTLIPSERVLVTKGSQAYMISLQSVRAGLTSPTELDQMVPLSHCAHYYFNRMCNRGERCNFIHAVHVDPNVQGDFKRAPGRGRHHPPPPATGLPEAKIGGGSGSRVCHKSNHTNKNNTTNNSSNDRAVPLPSESSSSVETRPPSSASNALPNDKRMPAPLPVKSASPHRIAEESTENSANSVNRNRIRGGHRVVAAANDYQPDRSSITNTDITSPINSDRLRYIQPVEESNKTAPTRSTRRQSSAAAVVAAAPPLASTLAQTAAAITLTTQTDGTRRRAAAIAQRGITPPPLTAIALQNDNNEETVAPRPHADRATRGRKKEVPPRHSQADASISASAFIASAAAAQLPEPISTPSSQVYGQFASCGANAQAQPSGSQEAHSQAGGSTFTSPQLTWLAQSDSESSYFSRSPQQQAQQYPHAQQQPQQYQPPLPSQQQPQQQTSPQSGPQPYKLQLPLSPYHPFSFNLPNYEHGSLNDSDALNTSHTSSSGVAHTVNVIPRTRRRRETAPHMQLSAFNIPSLRPSASGSSTAVTASQQERSFRCQVRSANEDDRLDGQQQPLYDAPLSTGPRSAFKAALQHLARSPFPNSHAVQQQEPQRRQYEQQ